MARFGVLAAEAEAVGNGFGADAMAVRTVLDALSHMVHVIGMWHGVEFLAGSGCKLNTNESVRPNESLLLNNSPQNGAWSRDWRGCYLWALRARDRPFAG